MRYYLRERFVNPFSNKYTTPGPSYYVVGSREDQVALFCIQQEALVEGIIDAYRRAAAASGIRPLDLVWAASDEQPAPLYATAPPALEMPPVFSFECETEGVTL